MRESVFVANVLRRMEVGETMFLAALAVAVATTPKRLVDDGWLCGAIELLGVEGLEFGMTDITITRTK